MQFLIDGSYNRILYRWQVMPTKVIGQLITPLTKYRYVGGPFAIDNGAFSAFNEKNFKSLLQRNLVNRAAALFVAAPDSVGDAETTYQLWKEFKPSLREWPLAYVSQDGDTRTPRDASTIFIGGTDVWKESSTVIRHVVKCVDKGLRVHVGRVNTIERYTRFEKAGAHTCDGSGVSRYDHMWARMWGNNA